MQYLMSLKAVYIVCSDPSVRRIRIILVNDGMLLNILKDFKTQFSNVNIS